MARHQDNARERILDGFEDLLIERGDGQVSLEARGAARRADQGRAALPLPLPSRPDRGPDRPLRPPGPRMTSREMTVSARGCGGQLPADQRLPGQPAAPDDAGHEPAAQQRARQSSPPWPATRDLELAALTDDVGDTAARPADHAVRRRAGLRGDHRQRAQPTPPPSSSGSPGNVLAVYARRGR